MKGDPPAKDFFFQKCHDIKVDQRPDQEGCLPHQENHFVPVHKIHISETACHKGIDDLEVKNE